MRADHPHKVKLSCHDVAKWENILLSTLSVFGVDSNRWQSESTFDDMTFYFADEKDALLFRLQFGEYVIPYVNNTEKQTHF